MLLKVLIKIDVALTLHNVFAIFEQRWAAKYKFHPWE
jgi:hypothetical protein